MSVAVALGVFYGLFMGLFALLTRPTPHVGQWLATSVKTPALFLLTLVVTFPSLYVFSALLGVRLGVVDTLRLIVSAIAVNLAVLASFGLITGFFTICTTSYHFMVLLNVAFFAIGGAIGLGFLMGLLRKLEVAQQVPQADEEPPAAQIAPAEGEDGDPADGEEPQPPDAPERNAVLPWPLPPRKTMARRVFQVWVLLYALVGAQMGWVLRPFVGAPSLKFQLFRPREGNIFLAVLRTLAKLLGG